jgi:hypothetical protein
MAARRVSWEAKERGVVPQAKKRWRSWANFYPPKMNVSFLFHYFSDKVPIAH